MDRILGVGNQFFPGLGIVSAAWRTEMQIEAAKATDFDSAALAKYTAHVFNDMVDTQGNIFFRKVGKVFAEFAYEL